MDDALSGVAFLIHRLEELVDYLVKGPAKGIFLLGVIALFFFLVLRNKPR